MKLNISLLALLCPVFLASGQQTNTYQITALQVGEAVPNMEITGLLNGKKASFNFADYKGKLLILDFWATWCSSCLHHFPAADSLQKQFPADIQIVLVDTKSTRNTREKVQNTLNHFPGFSLPSLWAIPSWISCSRISPCHITYGSTRQASSAP